MSWVEDAKRRAVLKALQPVKTGWIIGLGSGSTVAYAAAEISRLMRVKKLDLRVVPTSYQVENLATKHGLKTISMNDAFTIDYAIDGADQVDESTLNVIKGGGAAMLREKVVDSASRKLVIVVDETKLSKYLGGKQSVPLEVHPFAQKYVQAQVAKMGGRAKLREGAGKVGPVITDNGNLVLDADFGRLKDPERLNRKLRTVPGVLETGLFLGMVDCAYVGMRNGEVKYLDVP